MQPSSSVGRACNPYADTLQMVQGLSLILGLWLHIITLHTKPLHQEKWILSPAMTFFFFFFFFLQFSSVLLASIYILY